MHRSDLIGSAVARRLPVRERSLSPPSQEAEPAHVPGLYLICAVMLFERLASVMVFSLLVLYLNESLGMGAGWSAKAASYVFGLSYGAGVLVFWFSAKLTGRVDRNGEASSSTSYLSRG